MIEFNEFSFRYREGVEPVVRDITLAIPDGCFVGITGAAGSGKSTLTYAINGIIPHCYPGDFYGSVTVEGLDTVDASLTDLSRLVGSVCQDIDSQMVSTVVEDEILYGLENFAVPREEIPARVDEALDAMGIADLRDRTIDSLSGGQKQKVAVASVLALHPKVLVLDEPTAELDPASSVTVFDLLSRYAREHGTTVASVRLCRYARHRGRGPHPLRRYAGRGAGPLRGAAGARCERAALDDAYERAFRPGSVRRSHGAQRGRGRGGAEGGARMIEFKNVSASYDGELAVLADVSFTVNDGDFVAFVGTNGAGKSTTMRLANGLLKPTSGEVLIDGVPTTSLKTSELARRIGFLFQNPDRQICCNTVREELMFGFAALGEEGPGAEARVDAMIERFGFDADAEPYLLNRGTRQLLALASIIVLAPPTIILDEPTTGLDFRECVKVMDVVRELNENGTTVIMVCHDMEVVGDFARRVIAMTAGRVVADGPTFEVLRDGRVLKEAHILPPQVTEVSLILGREAACPAAVAEANTVAQMVTAVAQACDREVEDVEVEAID